MLPSLEKSYMATNISAMTRCHQNLPAAKDIELPQEEAEESLVERGISPAFELLEPLLASKKGLNQRCWLGAALNFPFQQRLQLRRQRPWFCPEDNKKRNH